MKYEHVILKYGLLKNTTILQKKITLLWKRETTQIRFAERIWVWKVWAKER